jgi:hypothetical protein
MGYSYPLNLKSLFIRGFNGKYGITPETVHGLTGLSFYGTNITIDNTVLNQKRDLFQATNLKGLCFVKD